MTNTKFIDWEYAILLTHAHAYTFIYKCNLSQREVSNIGSAQKKKPNTKSICEIYRTCTNWYWLLVLVQKNIVKINSVLYLDGALLLHHIHFCYLFECICKFCSFWSCSHSRLLNWWTPQLCVHLIESIHNYHRYCIYGCVLTAVDTYNGITIRMELMKRQNTLCHSVCVYVHFAFAEFHFFCALCYRFYLLFLPLFFTPFFSVAKLTMLLPSNTVQ